VGLYISKMKGPMSIEIAAKQIVVESYFDHSHLDYLVFGEAAAYSFSSVYELLQNRMLIEVRKIEDEAKR